MSINLNKYMKVFLLISENNKLEKRFSIDLAKKIENIGCSVEKENPKNCHVLVIVFDGRLLSVGDYIKMGMFLSDYEIKDKKKKVIFGFNISNQEVNKDVKKYLDHVVKTEYSLIGCLKDYLFFNKKQ
jgi:hypothetical protein